ncbi:MAG: hypothetical protein HY343_04795 [Lentisphaerae bacterium]|nr:hypothetical protein [Lentisphaerota bacterium]
MITCRPFIQHLTIRNIADGALLTLFLAIIVLPLVTDVSLEETEKRKLAEPPKFEWRTATAFPKKFDAYFNDRFGFRGVFIRINNLMKVKVFGRSPIDKVIVGKEGWLYYNSDKANDGISIADYRGLVAYTPKELDGILANLRRKKAWLDERGIGFVTIVCPNKQTIYPEYMPDAYTRVRPTGRLDQVMTLLKQHPDVAIVDPRPALLEMKPKCLVYLKTDTHWNDLGGFLAYRELLNVLRRQYPELKTAELTDYDVAPELSFGGDLAIMLAMWKDFSDIPVKLKAKPGAFDGVKKLGKALVFCDSFVWAFHPYLSNTFATVVTQDGPFDAKVVRAHKPDVVILEVVERYQFRLFK